MKKHIFFYAICLALCPCLSALSLNGQERQNKANHDWTGTDELTLTVGAPLPGPFIDLISTSGIYNAESVRDTDRRLVLPVFGLEYSSNLTTVIGFGAGVYYGYYQTPVSIPQDGADGLLRTEHSHYMQVMARVRFNWLNREKVRLYSAVGAGILLKYDNEVREDMLPEMPYRWRMLPWFDLCAVGVTVGRKLYGNFQVGIMSSGLITAGIGYRF